MNDKEKVMASETTIRDRSAVDWALLVARTVVGVIFMAHGAQKLFGAFGGPGLSAIVQMMGPLGVGARDHPIKCLRSARIFTIFKKRRQEPMISGRKPMISGIRAPIVSFSGGMKSRCSQSCRRMISGAYTYSSPPSRSLSTCGRRNTPTIRSNLGILSSRSESTA